MQNADRDRSYKLTTSGLIAAVPWSLAAVGWRQCDLRLVGGASWALACWAGPRTGGQLAKLSYKLESGPPED